MDPWYKDDSITIYNGDALEALCGLENESINCCVTSPPYWGLRNYGVPNQIGLEGTPEEYIKKIVSVFQQVKRVIKKDGTLWINIGDTYAGSWGSCSHDPNGKAKRANTYSRPPQSHLSITGLKQKDLMGIPWRVAFALQEDGWYLRSDIIWCLSGGTKVYARTQKGDMPMTLKDMYRLKPETVKLWNGERWAQLKGMSKSSRKGDEIELVLRSGERISCTPTHKWPTDKGLKMASELVKGDILERCFLPDSPLSNYPTYIPDEMGWFIGIYLAEGSRDAQRTIQIASHKKETLRFERLSKIASDYGCTCRKHNTSENGMTICLDGRILNAIIDTYLSGKNAKTKHLTTAAWQRSNLFLRFLLDGYLEGDGHWDENNKRYRLGFTRNDYLQDDLRTICSKLCANLTLKMAESSIGDKKYKTYRGEIRFETTFKGHWNQKNKNEIIEIRKSGARYFYDVGVEDEPHLFALASGVLTHNSKPNPMPESVSDRPTKSHEYIFLLSKGKRYYYDYEAIKEPVTGSAHARGNGVNPKSKTPSGWDTGPGNHNKLSGRYKQKQNESFSKAVVDVVEKRNKRSVWTVPTYAYPEAHFATFPPDLIKPCVLAGCPVDGVVLDPFAGSGTTLYVSKELNRKPIGIELNNKYCKLILKRTAQEVLKI